MIVLILLALYLGYKLLAKNRKGNDKKNPYKDLYGDNDANTDEPIDDEDEYKKDDLSDAQIRQLERRVIKWAKQKEELSGIENNDEDELPAETEDGNPFLPEEPYAAYPETITKIVFGWKKDYPLVVEHSEPIIGLQGKSDKIETYTEVVDAYNITMYILSDYQMYVHDSGILFGEFVNVTEIEFQNFNTQYMETMCSMFENCEKLERVDLSGFDTSKVVDMDNLFSECKSLKEVNLRGIDTKKVIYFQEVFAGCESLESIDLSGFDTRNGEMFTEMFVECRKLRTLDLSSFDTRKSYSMTNMFNDCENLETIYASDTFVARPEDDKDLEKIFTNCNKLCGTDIYGNKFRFDESKNNHAFARIYDKDKGVEGFFTRK